MNASVGLADYSFDACTVTRLPLKSDPCMIESEPHESAGMRFSGMTTYGLYRIPVNFRACGNQVTEAKSKIGREKRCT